MSRVSRLYQAALRRAGLSEREACKQAGVNESALKNMRTGQAQYPRLDTAVKLAKVLNIHPALVMAAAGGRLVAPDELRMSALYSELSFANRSRLLQLAEIMARDPLAHAVAPPSEDACAAAVAPRKSSPRKAYVLHDEPAEPPLPAREPWDD